MFLKCRREWTARAVFVLARAVCAFARAVCVFARAVCAFAENTHLDNQLDDQRAAHAAAMIEQQRQFESLLLQQRQRFEQ